MKFTSRLENCVRALARRTDRRRPVPQALADTGEAPLRSELFTAEQMAMYGKSLAAVHELTFERTPDQLLPRLASNERVLVAAFAQLGGTADAQRRATPAGEWLLDNSYLIEEEIRTAKRHLPPGYSRELPRLRHAPSAGLPRVAELLAADVLWAGWPQVAILAACALVVRTMRRWLGRDRTFFPVFALAASAAVPVLGLFVVFALLIAPALWRQAGSGWPLTLASAGAACALGLAGSWVLDAPSGACVALMLSAYGTLSVGLSDHAHRRR